MESCQFQRDRRCVKVEIRKKLDRIWFRRFEDYVFNWDRLDHRNASGVSAFGNELSNIVDGIGVFKTMQIPSWLRWSNTVFGSSGLWKEICHDETDDKQDVEKWGKEDHGEWVEKFWFIETKLGFLEDFSHVGWVINQNTCQYGGDADGFRPCAEMCRPQHIMPKRFVPEEPEWNQEQWRAHNTIDSNTVIDDSTMNFVR